MHDIGGELSQALSDTTKSPAAAAANSLYDVFVWNDSGTYLSPAALHGLTTSRAARA